MNVEQKIKILICDDHPIMRFGIAAIIQSQSNMTVAGQAGTAEEAIRLFWEHRPDITLMDLRLPDGSGLELIRELQSRAGGGSKPAVRGIALSGFGMEDDVRKSKEAGFFDHLTKPINFQKLEAAIRAAAIAAAER